MAKSRSSAKGSAASSAPAGRRPWVVFFGLVGALTMTSMLLLAISPAPLMPTASATLFAIDAPSTLQALFQTQSPIPKQKWKAIYLHHSRTPGGNADTLARPDAGLADHFVIGNGDGCVDGAIEIGHRWQQQLSALPPDAQHSIEPSCISICLVGDFDQAVPTPAQMRRLAQLVSALQVELAIPAQHVLMREEPKSVGGMGKRFPITAFREQLLQ